MSSNPLSNELSFHLMSEVSQGAILFMNFEEIHPFYFIACVFCKISPLKRSELMMQGKQNELRREWGNKEVWACCVMAHTGESSEISVWLPHCWLQLHHTVGGKGYQNRSYCPKTNLRKEDRYAHLGSTTFQNKSQSRKNRISQARRERKKRFSTLEERRGSIKEQSRKWINKILHCILDEKEKINNIKIKTKSHPVDDQTGSVK